MLENDGNRSNPGDDEGARKSSRTKPLTRTPEKPKERRTGERYQLKPDKYDGTTPLEIFFLQFDNCVEHNQWTTNENLAQLKGALKGTAAQVLMGAQGAELGYLGLREELQKCFGVEGHTAQFRTMLKTRRRHPGESLRSLYQDICRLLMLAYPGPQNELRDLLAVEAFVDSLDDVELEVSVKDKFPRNLAEAFQAALRLEANRPSSRKSREEDRGRSTESRAKTRFRNDMESWRVEWREVERVWILKFVGCSHSWSSN